MATKKAHCLGDVDAIHIPCGGQGVVMRGAKTVTIAGVGVRLAIRGRNSHHASSPFQSHPPHEGFLIFQMFQKLFCEGRGICREFDNISINQLVILVRKSNSIVNSFVYVGD